MYLEARPRESHELSRGKRLGRDIVAKVFDILIGGKPVAEFRFDTRAMRDHTGAGPVFVAPRDHHLLRDDDAERVLHALAKFLLYIG